MSIFSRILSHTGLEPYYNWLRAYHIPSAYKRESQRLSQKRIVFYSQFIRKGDLCFDIGANLGNRTEAFLALGARVVAIEPQPHCCRFLRFRFGRKVHIEEVALGEKQGLQILHQSAEHMLSSLSDEWITAMKQGRFSDCSWDISLTIRTETLDHLVQKYGIPAFCKIDVEGYELEVLKGLTTPLRYLSFEYVLEMHARMLQCLDYLHNMDPEITVNFSVGESMQLAWPTFRPFAEACSYFQTNDFKRTGGGDVYVCFSERQVDSNSS